MNEELQFTIDTAKEAMENGLKHLEKQLSNIRAGKASPAMLGSVMVDYYGTQTPINQVANVNTPDGRTISVQPWEKSMLGPIEKSIFEANLGLTPMNDGEFVRITIPPLTEERRKQMVKQAKSLCEDAKVSLRSSRHKMLDFIKKEVKEIGSYIYEVFSTSKEMTLPTRHQGFFTYLRIYGPTEACFNKS